MHRPLTDRDITRLEAECRAHRAAKLQRDHDLDLLLNAGVSLAEALRILDA